MAEHARAGPGRAAMVVLMALLLAGCSGQGAEAPRASPTASPPTPAPTTAPTVAPTPAPTAAPTAVPATASPIPAPAGAVLSAAQVGESLIRALFAHDELTVRMLDPLADPAQVPAGATLASLTVVPLTRQEAGDSNPASKMDYARATGSVDYQGKTTAFDWVMVTEVLGGHRLVLGMLDYKKK